MKKFGVLGFPVKHSLSPAMYKAGFEKIGFEGIYEFCEVEPNDFNCFMKRVKTGEYAGLSVTVPYKERVMDYCDVITDVAKKIGAVNLLYFDAGKFVGDNTDWFGFITALKEVESNLGGKKVLIMGAGGAARACIFALNEIGIKPYLVNRTKSKALELAEEFLIEVVDFENLPASQVVVNCTSVGLSDSDPCILPEDYLSNGVDVVFDLIYKDTSLVLLAKKNGLKTIDAKRMLLWQGVKQFEKFTKLEVPVEEMWKSINNI